MKYIFTIIILVQSLFSAEDLVSCVQTEVSKTSVIFTCMHGEYYVEYENFSKREVRNLRVLYTKADKYKYMKELNPKDKNRD